ncbi:MAG: dihydrofolate reductase [Thaumarchaeota archaeon]|nr:dihydrofolate reductase [Nitrososphaerota archaeon]
MGKPFRPIIIVAVDTVGGFGKNRRIPWHLPEDLQRFKKITEGHICVMGRHTYNDILDARLIRDKERGEDKPITEILRGRQSFVVTSNKDMVAPGVTKIKNMGEVQNLIAADDPRQIFVIGGERMFIQALSWSDQIMMTVVKGKPFDCDVFFPVEILNKKWKIVSGEETDKAYFIVYNRK